MFWQDPSFIYISMTWLYQITFPISKMCVSPQLRSVDILVDLTNVMKTTPFDIWPLIFWPPFEIIFFGRGTQKKQQIWNTDILAWYSVITSMRMSVIFPNITYIARMEMIQLDDRFYIFLNWGHIIQKTPKPTVDGRNPAFTSWGW